MLRRTNAILVALVVSTPTFLLMAPATLAGTPVIPMPGEQFLTDAERALALRTMGPQERRVVAPLLKDAGPLVVAYTRRAYRVVDLPDGSSVPEPVAPDLQLEGSALRLPSEETASTATKPGTDLYISFTVVRTRSTSPYEWQVVPYAEWRGRDGMHRGNSSAETMALAWAGGAWVHSQRGGGELVRTWPCNASPIDVWASDGTPNTGTAWSFHEWGYWWGCSAWWAFADIRLRQDRWQGRTDNLVYKYYHTYGGLEYSFSFSRSPGVVISPTAEQWALTVFETYRH